MKAFAKLYWLFSASICNFTNAVIIQGTVPKSLWGKKVVLNGPQNFGRDTGSKTAFISNPGHITSVTLIGENHVVVSEAFIKPEKEGFNVGDLYNKDFVGIFRKLISSNSITDFFTSGLCHTAVEKIKDIENIKYVINLQGDEPQILTEDIINLDKNVRKLNSKIGTL